MFQEELKRRAKGRGKSKASRNYFLSGLMVCSKCKCNMSGHSKTRVKSGEKYFYYRCSKCNTSIPAEAIESKVLSN